MFPWVRRIPLLIMLVACAGARVHTGDDAGSAPASNRVFDLDITKRRVASAPSTIRVQAGDRVELRWTTDEATTVHLHGYDIEVPIDPGSLARMRFVARTAGRFPIRAHGFGANTGKQDSPAQHREAILLYLEVLPR